MAGPRSATRQNILVSLSKRPDCNSTVDAVSDVSLHVVRPTEVSGE